jgi:hypothetical protein
MTDLKPYYDRVIAAQAKEQSVVNEIAEAMQLNDPTGDQLALELEAKLDAATKERDDMERLYAKVVNANKGSDVIANFVPASSTPTTPDEPKAAGTHTRAEFMALKPAERMKFVRGGGVVTE